MKKEYDKKKKLVIFILTAVAVCLAGGLCFYLVKIGTPKEPEKESVQQVTEQMEVTVPEIDITKESEKPEVKDTDAAENPEQPPQYDPEVKEPEQKPEEPAGGSTNDGGQVYVPGFGYVDQPGAPQGESAGSDGDWNKQIGDMN